MKINADFDQRVLLHADEISWADSPMPGVSRRPLDRIGEEVARATTIVRYAPDSHFSAHTHDGGEEFLVLEGVFEDEHGAFAAGSYIRNPPTSSHTPGSAGGCVIFVKLWQFDPDDRSHIRIDTGKIGAVADAARPGVEVTPLFKDPGEDVRIEPGLPGQVSGPRGGREHDGVRFDHVAIRGAHACCARAVRHHVDDFAIEPELGTLPSRAAHEAAAERPRVAHRFFGQREGAPDRTVGHRRREMCQPGSRQLVDAHVACAQVLDRRHDRVGSRVVTERDDGAGASERRRVVPVRTELLQALPGAARQIALVLTRHQPAHHAGVLRGCLGARLRPCSRTRTDRDPARCQASEVPARPAPTTISSARSTTSARYRLGWLRSRLRAAAARSRKRS